MELRNLSLIFTTEFELEFQYKDKLSFHTDTTPDVRCGIDRSKLVLHRTMSIRSGDRYYTCRNKASSFEIIKYFFLLYQDFYV